MSRATYSSVIKVSGNRPEVKVEAPVPLSLLDPALATNMVWTGHGDDRVIVLGSQISQWNNRVSGGGDIITGHATDGNSAVPYIDSRDINATGNKQAINCGTTNNHKGWYNTGVLNTLISADEWHVFVVVFFNVITADDATPQYNHCLMSEADTGNGAYSSDWALVLRNDGGSDIVQAYVNSGTSSIISVPAFENTPMLIEWWADGVNHYLRVNDGSVAQDGNLAFTHNGLRVGSVNNDGGWGGYQNECFEIAIANAEIPEANAVRGYFEDKYAISI
jgi:hypothetical protein